MTNYFTIFINNFDQSISGLLTVVLRERNKTAGNSTYMKVAVQRLNQALCIYQSLCLAGQ